MTFSVGTGEFMRKSVKAALLSGLLFPGIGHLSLKQRGRGWMLIGISLLAIVLMGWVATQQALIVVDDVMSGNVAPDSASIEQMLENSSSESGELIANLSLVVLGACWLFGIVDSYRLGSRLDKDTIQLR